MSNTIEKTPDVPDHDHKDSCDCEAEFMKLQEMELDNYHNDIEESYNVKYI